MIERAPGEAAPPGRDLALSFARSAEEYERGRNGYPDEAIDAAGVPAEAVVLDLAAGTGKLTRQLVARHARVIAVEPAEAMRAILSRVVPGAEAVEGFAEAIPLPDDSTDAVFVAEAFHWFGAEAVDEIARVLRPGGVLAILFNRPEGSVEPPLPAEFHRVFEAETLQKPAEQTIGSGLWRRPFPGPFEAFAESAFPHAVERDRDQLLAMFASWSVVAALPAERRKRLLARLRELVPDQRYVSTLRCELSLARLRDPGARPQAARPPRRS